MENLSIQDAPPPGTHQGPGAPPQAPAQLPPQMFTTAAQLLDLTDKKLMIALRDGRKLIGVLRSWDQFANLVLQSTIERFFASSPDSSAPGAPRGYYADVTHGIFLVRGRTSCSWGDRPGQGRRGAPGYERGELDFVKKLAEEKKAADRAREKARLKKLATLGFEGRDLGIWCSDE
uniref:U6 snRNA-associated Sm-like protein LSm1 n=1 Tax=Bionectria ochroleuca TaxID=29856 RepID=A0A8H7TSZ0_BIOOC